MYGGPLRAPGPFYVEPILLSSPCFAGYARSLLQPLLPTHTFFGLRREGTERLTKPKTAVFSTLATCCLVGVFIE